MLLTKPALLLLDEPTKGLDPQFKLVVAQKLRALADSGVTIVVATHDLPFAALVGDYATMLFDGQAAATQPSASLFADNLFYRPLDDAFAKRWRASQARAGEQAQAEAAARPQVQMQPSSQTESDGQTQTPVQAAGKAGK